MEASYRVARTAGNSSKKGAYLNAKIDHHFLRSGHGLAAEYIIFGQIFGFKGIVELHLDRAFYHLATAGAAHATFAGIGQIGTGGNCAIEQIVKTENLEFCKNRAIYDLDYFKFIFSLVQVFKENEFRGETRQQENDKFAINAANMGLEFIFNTFFKASFFGGFL